MSYATAIAASGRSIYDEIPIGDPDLWIPSPDLERLVLRSLLGHTVASLAIRTRSKVVKELVCQSLGYTPPSRFKRTRPRFPGQNFDVYVQKANNLQIWNEDIEPGRRYVIIGVSALDEIDRVRVIGGATLAKLATTGTLTHKYQARLVNNDSSTSELLSSCDTALLQPHVAREEVDLQATLPSSNPSPGAIIPISSIYEKLLPLVGHAFPDTGSDQERNRGAVLHREICRRLGFTSYRDDGRFPDITNQLIEVKLQTSPTIDLGLVRPDSTAPLDIPAISGHFIRHCDVRYVLFRGHIDNGEVRLTNLFATTGEAFTARFPLFQGKILNKKIQIHLPSDFFS